MIQGVKGKTMNKFIHNSLKFVTALALVTMIGSMPAHAAQAVPPYSESVTSVVSLDLVCSNNPGPQVTISGAFLIGGFPVQIGFYQNKNKQLTLLEEVEVQLVLGDPIVFAKQKFTGNPILTAQLSMNGVPYGGPVNLGRCVQGGKKHHEIEVPTDLLVALLVAGLDCQNSPGPQIRLTGTEAVIDGLSVTITGKNNAQGTHTQTQSSDIVSAGISFPLDPVIVVPKQDVGGNPIISVNGTKLGRCNKI